MCHSLRVTVNMYINWCFIRLLLDIVHVSDVLSLAVHLLCSWTHVRWLDPNSTYMRVVAVSILVIMWQVMYSCPMYTL